MDEKKFAVMLTDTQEIKTLECDPQEELFEIAMSPMLAFLSMIAP